MDCGAAGVAWKRQEYGSVAAARRPRWNKEQHAPHTLATQMQLNQPSPRLRCGDRPSSAQRRVMRDCLVQPRLARGDNDARANNERGLHTP